ncbi:mCG1043298, partial [Mus musculus]
TVLKPWLRVLGNSSPLVRFSLEYHQHLSRCCWSLRLDTKDLFLPIASKLLSHDFFLVSPVGSTSLYSRLLFSSQISYRSPNEISQAIRDCG